MVAAAGDLLVLLLLHTTNAAGATNSWTLLQTDDTVDTQPPPTVQEQNRDTDYDCCNLFCDSKSSPGCNASHDPPADWRKRFPGGL